MKRALLVLLVACKGDPPPPPMVGARVGPALTAALAAAETIAAPWRCAAEDGPAAADEAFTAGERSWQVAGHALASDGELAIGVIADAGGAAPSTIAALGRLRRTLRVDLVLALGGMGASRGELEAVLTALADPRAPVVALPGDLEAAGALAEAAQAQRQRGAIVLDGRTLQRIELGGATIALVPGAGAASRLVAGAEGCAYTAADAGRIWAELSAQPGLRILASAEAPRDGATGERALVGDGAIDLALHGPMQASASPAQAGGRDGRAVSLSPGTSDALPRLPGGARAPTAGVLTLRGRAWRWQPITDVK